MADFRDQLLREHTPAARLPREGCPRSANLFPPPPASSPLPPMGCPVEGVWQGFVGGNRWWMIFLEHIGPCSRAALCERAYRWGECGEGHTGGGKGEQKGCRGGGRIGKNWDEIE